MNRDNEIQPGADNLLEDLSITKTVRRWVESFVIGMNLCPFARREFLQERIRFAVTQASTETDLLMALEAELEILVNNPAVETTLLIHPGVLQDFHDYNQFLDYADGLLLQMGLEGVYQVASFHPDYQFDDADPDAVENYTNRSPYPMLHLIREASLDLVLADYPDPEEIPRRNIEHMKKLGKSKLKAILQACYYSAE